MSEKCSFYTRSEEESFFLGELLGSLLPRGAFVVLKGELGCGKTVLAKGIASSLGISKEELSSPSFNIVHEYDNLVHFDFYRLSSPEELWELGFDELLSDDRVKVAEWGELALELLDFPIVVECKEKGEGREFTLYDPTGKICSQLKKLWRERCQE